MVKYTIKKNRRSKSLRILVRDGEVVVTMPWRLPKYFADKFVESKRAWIEEKLEEQKLKPKKLLLHHSVKEFAENKERALATVRARVAYFNSHYNFEIGNITIRNQRSRWGSCSSKKNLNFNYKIVFLPPELVDYIVVHELCHLKEMNHGKRFWYLVGEQVGDYKERRSELKGY
jgi:predicted metal-dependent hydrolase